jgi:hypothetical protein
MPNITEGPNAVAAEFLNTVANDNNAPAAVVPTYAHMGYAKSSADKVSRNKEPTSFITTIPMNVYKAGIIVPHNYKQSKKSSYPQCNICIALQIPPGTLCIVMPSYRGGEYIYRFASAEVIDYIRYPNVPITIPPSHKVVSSYEPDFEYPKGSVVNAKPDTLTTNNLCGIYTFKSLEAAWTHCYEILSPTQLSKLLGSEVEK